MGFQFNEEQRNLLRDAIVESIKLKGSSLSDGVVSSSARIGSVAISPTETESHLLRITESDIHTFIAGLEQDVETMLYMRDKLKELRRIDPVKYQGEIESWMEYLYSQKTPRKKSRPKSRRTKRGASWKIYLYPFVAQVASRIDNVLEIEPTKKRLITWEEGDGKRDWFAKGEERLFRESPLLATVIGICLEAVKEKTKEKIPTDLGRLLFFGVDYVMPKKRRRSTKKMSRNNKSDILRKRWA